MGRTLLPHNQSKQNARPELRVEIGRVSLPDYEAENRALVSLSQEMANSPQNVLQRIVELAMELCKAHSAGVSLLDSEGGKEISAGAL